MWKAMILRLMGLVHLLSVGAGNPQCRRIRGGQSVGVKPMPALDLHSFSIYRAVV